MKPVDPGAAASCTRCGLVLSVIARPAGFAEATPAQHRKAPAKPQCGRIGRSVFQRGLYTWRHTT